MPQLPALFISHGAPDLPIRAGATQDFRRRLPEAIPYPQAILVVSAHWSTAQPTLGGAIRPQTIHDFGGFPKALYQLHYPVLGAPDLAEDAAKLLTQAGFSPQVHPTRGLDHGAWTPLLVAYPEAAIPIVQLSIQAHQPPAYHHRIGQALAPLRDKGVLIVGSGAATHNLGAFVPDYSAPPPDWVAAFDQWLAAAIAQNAPHQLLNYRAIAPYAVRNHPTDEHLLPLFVALGAGGRGRKIHHGFTYGAFSMAAYAFD